MWALAPGTCPLVATSNPFFATNPIRQTLHRASGTATEGLTGSGFAMTIHVPQLQIKSNTSR
jgi:hypothetical protein